jgi:hypothetical protein
MLLFAAAENLTDINFSSTEAEIALKSSSRLMASRTAGIARQSRRTVARGLTTSIRSITAQHCLASKTRLPRPMPARFGDSRGPAFHFSYFVCILEACRPVETLGLGDALKASAARVRLEIQRRRPACREALPRDRGRVDRLFCCPSEAPRTFTWRTMPNKVAMPRASRLMPVAIRIAAGTGIEHHAADVRGNPFATRNECTRERVKASEESVANV